MSNKKILIHKTGAFGDDNYLGFVDHDTWVTWLDVKETEDPKELENVWIKIRDEFYSDINPPLTLKEVRDDQQGESEYYGTNTGWTDARTALLLHVSDPVFYSVSEAINYAKENDIEILREYHCY